MEASAIAVIGMAGRFPGAGDVRAFWENLSAGVESVHYFTDDELRAAGETEKAIADPTYVKACGRIEGIERFDAAFFGLSPRDAAIFDPQHRLLLECAWEAFEHAGYVGEAVEGPVGVFATCGMNEYMIKNVMTNPEVMANVGEWLVRHTGNDTNFLATRISYELNLRGPSVNVQTACSSALVAIHVACQSLLNGECDLALAGGATLYAEQNKGYFWREGEIFSTDGHTRSFDASATGTTMSNAVACVVLKRLSDAERDGDNILAIVRGSAINNDGRDKVGYLAPSVSGQAGAVTEALQIAGVSPEQVSYVEAHGTGTRIGDPIEIAALTQAFRASTDKAGYCAIGSLKSNIGHTGEASGCAAFIKVVLALQNRRIPPSLHYESPNPQCEFASSPFFVNTTLRPWEATPRIAGVTSLGAGGTNCHVVLEEAPPVRPGPEPAPARDHHLLVVSAKTEGALEAATQNLAQHLADHPDASLADVAFTLTVGRKAFRHRRAIVAKDAREATRAIAAMDRRVVTGQKAGEARTLAFLLPDGNAWCPGVGRGLYRAERAFREAADVCLRFLPPRLKDDLRELMFPAPGPIEEAAEAREKLERPSLALPALFIVEYALAKLLVSWGVAPTALLGHGAGEYAAACLAGVLSVEDALALAASRGLLAEASAPADPADFAALCRTLRFETPRVRFVSSGSGTWITDAQATDPQYWVDQLRSTVPFEQGLRALLEDRDRVLVEVGPGRTLGPLTERHPRRPTTLATMGRPDEPGADLEFLLAALGGLWTGGEIEPNGLYEGQARRRVPLPTYPWQRQKYWLAPGKAAAATSDAVEPAPASPPMFERPEVNASFVAPRSPMEQELAAMWRDLLGVERIGVHDDFFELGGQSLVGVRFFAQVRKKYGVDFPLSTLLDAPTIEKCAAIVSATLKADPKAKRTPVSAEGPDLQATRSGAHAQESSTHAPAHEFRSLVAVQQGDGRRPFFCVHGAGGNVLNFRDLSRMLRAEQPFYGLQARGIDGILRPRETIEAMAAAYLEEVRARQPRGPYMLGGYSGGGLVALEMAQRLTEAGDVVDLLALIDTFHPATPVRKMTPARRIERVCEEGVAYFRGALEHKIEDGRARRKLDEARRFVAAGQPIPPELREVYLVRSFQDAVARYRARPWGGRAILFRAEEVEYIFADASPAYGWEDFLPRIEVSRVPGNHASLLLVPHASVLVEALGRAIGEASGIKSGSLRFAVSHATIGVMRVPAARVPAAGARSGPGSRSRWQRAGAGVAAALTRLGPPQGDPGKKNGVTPPTVE